MIVRFVLLAALAGEALGKLDVQLDDASSDASSSNITLLDAAPSLLFKRATLKKGCSPRNCGSMCDKPSKKRDLHNFIKRAEPRATEPDACNWAGEYHIHEHYTMH
jgi:hypothetical protein